MKTHDDNLKALLQRFVDDASAEAMAEDIQKGDMLLESFPAPLLAEGAEARIRRRVERAGRRQRRARGILVAMNIAAACVVLFIVLNGSRESAPPVVQPESKPIALAAPSFPVRDLPASLPGLWDNAYQAGGNELYTAMQEELDNISASIEAVRVKVRIRTPDFPADRYRYRDDVEARDSQLVTTDFWKG